MFVPSLSSASHDVDVSMFTDAHIDQENHTTQVKQYPNLNRNALANLDCNSTQLLPTGDCSRIYKPPTQQQPKKPSFKPKKLDAQTDARAGNILVSRRNERERNRVRLMNMGFERLRAVVPSHSGEQLSKISTLKKAIWYIEHLDRVLHGQNEPPLSIPYPAITTIPSTVVVAQDSKTFLSTCDNGGTTRIGVAGVGTGATSWSSPANTPGFHTIRGGRPVQHASSPIFPSRWDIGCANNIIASTPKFPHCGPGPSAGAVNCFDDSGYLSLEAKQHPFYNLESYGFPIPPLLSQRPPGSTHGIANFRDQ
ncbi:unnamed protein product [Dicrocoelium dendriticum]|nr:unnamed protein product [Dicrocoelium dendriticum]